MILLNVFDVGVNVTFTGLVIVFGMLILLVFILSAFGLVSNFKERRQVKKSKDQLSNNFEADESNIIEPVAEVNSTETEEIIAVISAAVASIYSKSSKKPVIKSIKHNSNARPIWASAGIIDNTRAF